MIRLARQVFAAAALVAAMLLHDLAAVVEPVWAYVAASFGVWLAVATAVQLIKSVAVASAVQQIVSARPKPVMFAASPPLTPERAAELAAKIRRAGEIR